MMSFLRHFISSARCSHLLLLLALVLISTDSIIAYVEGMILGWYIRIVASLHDERVGLASHHMNLGNEQTIDIPGDAPAHMTCKHKRGVCEISG